jgi:predicted metal-dependent peptidase
MLSQGCLPSELERLIVEAGRPRVDWRHVLASFVISASRHDYRWLPPSRRHLGRGFALPSLQARRADVAVALDTSGSVSAEELARFVEEVRGIVAVLPVRLLLIACDAAVHTFRQFEVFEPVAVPAVGGGGGTDFRPAFERLESDGIQPACLVYFTDALGTFPERAPDYAVLWVVQTRAHTLRLSEEGAADQGAERRLTPWGMEVQLAEDGTAMQAWSASQVSSRIGTRVQLLSR